MMDQGFHRALHLAAARGKILLSIVQSSRAQFLNILFQRQNDAEIAGHATGWASKPQLGESASDLSIIDRSWSLRT
jgi:hypothetical protein